MSARGHYVAYSERVAERLRLPLVQGDLAGAARAAHGLADAAQTRAVGETADPLPECGAGCAFCCHVHVDATEAEVAAIAAYLRERRGAAELGEFRETLAAHVARADALSDEARWEARIPCVLLDDGGRCSVYAVRPLRCRAFHSTSREACRDAFRGVSGEPPPRNRTVIRAVELVEDALLRALESAGNPVTAVRLERRLLELL